MSTHSRMSTRQIQELCPQHEGQLLTNFCAAITCVKALCPECIEQHYDYHRNIRTPPEIDSFKSLKNRCVAKLTTLLQKVEGPLLTASDFAALLQSALQRMNESRQRCHRVIEAYFRHLEEFLRSAAVAHDQPLAQAERISSIIAQIRMLSLQLDNPESFLKYAETVVKLDCNKIEERIKQGQTNLQRFKETQKSMLTIQKDYQSQLYALLGNLCYAANKGNVKSQPRQLNQLIAQQATDGRKQQMEMSRQQMEMSRQQMTDNMKNQMTVGRKDRIKSGSGDDDARSTGSKRSRRDRGGREVLGVSTFSAGSVRKYLHFFDAQLNALHYLDLEEGEEFGRLSIGGKYTVPDFHKSVVVASGELFLIGGSVAGVKNGKIFRYNFDNGSLQVCATLRYPRSSHVVCVNSRYIYILGGYGQQQKLMNKVQRFDSVSNQVEELSPMPHDVASMACCAFGGRYIYVLGGVNAERRATTHVDRFDEKTGQWKTVAKQLQGVERVSTAALVQVTQQQLMLVGGYNDSNEGQRQTYFLRVEDDSVSVVDLNMHPLPLAEGFWNCTPVLHKKLLFLLQNVPSPNSDQCSASLRKILVFDGAGWRILN